MISNNNEGEYIYELFEEQVTNRPDEIIMQDCNNQITFRNLNNTANGIARMLISHNVLTGDIIAVDTRSPIEMTAGIMAILKVGGVYMPIDAARPHEYIHYQLEHSKAKYLLALGRCDDYQKELKFKGKILFLDSIVKEKFEENNKRSMDPYLAGDTGNLLAIIYASHSSGKPQGITLSYRKIADWIKFNSERLNVDFTSTLFISSFTMKTSFPIWLNNLVTKTGGSLYFYDPPPKPGFGELRSLMRCIRFKSVVCPLYYLQALVESEEYKRVFSENIANIVSMGEENFNTEEFKKFLKEKKIRWHNYYGFPGMNMITNLVKSHLRGEVDFKHIGKPGSGTCTYILNQARREVAMGLSGDLYVSGIGIMEHYHGNRELNSEHFFENPIQPGERILKTGYRACWLPEGKLSLLGRTDNLVNINGTRAAPEEVEAALFRHPLVKDCAVTAKEFNDQSTRLTAYLVLKEDIPGDSLEEFLKNILPDVYFPIGFMRMHSLPRTPDGIVDIKYLKESEYVDSLQVQYLEKKIREFPQIEQAAVLVKEKTAPPVPLYIKDYVPDLPPVSFKKKEESFQTPKQSHPEPERSVPALIHGTELEWEEGDPRTIPQALKRAASQHGENGIVFIQADGTSHFQSYSSLYAEAEKVLAGLRKAGLKPQDKVLFQFNRNEDFVSAFWGCMLGGIVPVPLMVPKSFAKTGNETETLRRIWELLEHPTILSNKQLESSLRSFFKDFRVEKIEDLRDNEGDKNWYECSPEDAAMILFTSGSTGIPKGVVQCHRSIISREKSTTIYNGGSHNDVSINWMPLEHVGGVVMFHLNDVYMGCQQIQVSTEYILTDPLRWLDIIHRYKGTITWAPNFACALVSEQVEKNLDRSWDLSTMRFILNGGEAINAISSRKFLNLLAPFDLAADVMKPAWGMSETCSGVTYSHLFTTRSEQGIHYLDKQALANGLVKKNTSISQPHTGAFVELGKPIPGTSIRVVDSSNRTIKEGVVGRLQVRGPTVTSGYYLNPELNKEVFTSDGWFDTGDLAFILEARMTICGRAKDVIIINGVNLNSMEIEAAVEEVEGVETSFTAACAVREENNNTDQVVIFYHSTYTDFNQVLNQVKQIRKKFAEKFGLNLDYVVPVAKEDIPKTSIGKIQRLKLARSFQQGAFQHIVKQIDIGLKNENTLPPWFFKKTWRQHSPAIYDDTVARGPRTCLIFEDDAGLSDALVEQLERENCICIKVKPGNKFQSPGAADYRINHRETGHYRRLIMEIEKNDFQIDDIFHLFGYRSLPGDPGETDSAIINDEHCRGLYSLLYLLQVLEANRHRAKRLFAVTSDGQFTSPQDRAGYRQCSVSGFLKSVFLELDWLHCCHVDLDTNPDPAADSTSVYLSTQAQCLIKEWKNTAVSPEVAYRKGLRLQPLLERIDVEREEKQALPIKRGGIYLVTGGLGGIGTHVCRWLLESCAARLIIVGRTPLPGKKEWNSLPDENEESPVSKRIRSYLDLEAAVCRGEFFYAAGDASDLTFLNRLVDQAESQWQESLAGVFHIAGSLPGSGNLEHHWKVMDKHRAVKETRQTFEEAFQSKVSCTLGLHQLLKDRKEAIFVGFSSTMAFFGSPTFSAYSAANSFLDGFCRYRKASGWPNTYCLNWSYWENVGMGENSPEPMVSAMSARGYDSILPGQGVSSLQIALRLTPRQLFIGLNAGNPHIRGFMGSPSSANQELGVYYTTKNRNNSDVSKWRNSILDLLPVPASNNRIQVKLHPVDEFPLIDGKFIDYKRLEEQGGYLRDAAFEDERPRTETEKELASIWREILGKTHIGINDNFFELGGQSLKATIMVSKIHRVTGVLLTLAEIFVTPTIKELARCIDKTKKNKYTAIEPVEKKEYYTLSPAQKRLYILQQMQPGSSAYNIPEVVELEGEHDINKLEAAFVKITARHESLRTSFEIVDEKPVQKIYSQVDFKIGYSCLENEIAAAKNIRDFVKPFDLSKAPLFRVGLINVENQKQILMMDTHHIISDGTSLKIFVREILALYELKKLPMLRIQYKDFSEWQNSEYQRNVRKQQEEFWLNEFKGEIPVLNIPTDFPRPPIQSFEGSEINFELSAEEKIALNQITQVQGATFFMVYLSLYNILLYKLCGQEDIIIGTPVAGRRHAELQGIIGMMVNTLALRNFPGKEKTFREFLQEVKNRALQSFENQEYPFEDLVDKVVSERDIGRNPLVDVMLVLDDNFLEVQNRNVSNKAKILAAAQGDELKTIPAKFDLVLTAAEYENKLIFSFLYCTKLFKRETIERFMNYLRRIIYCIVKKNDVKISDIEIISDEEKNQILYDFNNNRSEFPGNQTIHQLFEAQAERTPDSIGVAGMVQGAQGAQWMAISYRELKQKSHQLAYLLQVNGLKHGGIVAVVLERSIDMIIGLLGILKAGGAYLPIDLDSPQARINYMLADSSAKIVVTTEDLADKVKSANCQLVMVNCQQEEPVANLSEGRRLLPETCNLNLELAYVIYTSGTTGLPKGVTVRHKGFVNLVYDHRKLFGENTGTRMSQVANPCFDAMAFEVWPCLLNGASLVIADNYTRIDAGRMKSWLIKNQITLSFQPTVMGEQLLKEDWSSCGSSLRILRVAGDMLKSYPADSIPFQFYNLYGPTEDTVWTTWARVGSAPEGNRYPHIGRPVANHFVYIMESGIELKPPGASGELCISGEGLAVGYLNRPELTYEKFIENPFMKNQRLYRTGDLARWLSDGNIEFLGRIDQQVKIRGFRIELKEIENQLLKNEKIKQTLVTTFGSTDFSDIKDYNEMDKSLAAYIVSSEELTAAELRTDLIKVLPTYMIPAFFIQVEKIPLTPNGKVNKRALSPLGRRLGTGVKYMAPQNKTEKLIASTWKKVLNVEQIGIHDNFFDIGGNSLTIVQVNNILKESLGIDIEAAAMFQYPTIHSLSRYLNRNNTTEKQLMNENENNMFAEVEDTMRETVQLFEHT